MDQSTTAFRIAEATRKGRLEMYANIHRALRMAMQQTLTGLGAMDPADRDDVAKNAAAVTDLLELLAIHLDDENRFVHSALAARRPGSEQQTAADHVDHLNAIGALREQLEAARRPDGTMTPADALAFYRRLALFVAENLEHMHYEETHNQAALWAVYSDEELIAIEQAIVASLPPAVMGRMLHWLLPANPHAERVAMLAGMKAGAPRPVFESAAMLARQRLTDTDWLKLADALDITPDQGT